MGVGAFVCVLGRWDGGTCWSAGSADIFGVCNTLRRERASCSHPFSAGLRPARVNSTQQRRGVRRILGLRFLSLSHSTPSLSPSNCSANTPPWSIAACTPFIPNRQRDEGESLMCTRLYAQSSSYCSLISRAIALVRKRCGS